MRCFIVPEGGSTATQDSYSQIIAIHAALLPNGKIVFFSGDQHDPGQFANNLFDHARLFDCSTLAVTSCTAAPGITDLFCCGHAFLPDGRLLIAGGTLRFAGFLGTRNAWIFDPATSSFQSAAQMAHGRWYPTLLTLGNGRVLAVSGINDDPNNVDQNRDIEVFDGSNWLVEGVLSYGTDSLYPRMHLLPDGRVFFVTSMNNQCMAWSEGMAAPAPVCASPFTMGFSEYTSVLLPLLYEDSYAPRILAANMQQPQIIDLTAASPAWSNTNARSLPASGAVEANPPRVNGTLTLLPTGEVLSAGGEQNYGDETRPVLPLEIYRHETNSWAVMTANTTVNRAYHSVALLMPDGRVWFAGSDKRCDWSLHNSGDYQNMPQPTDPQEIKNGVPVDNRELRIEIFEPWYFSRPDRPSISITQQSVGVGRSITFTSPQAASISRVALVRAGSSTHAFNSDQRYVGIPFTVNGNSVEAVVPNNEHLVPPGPYMLFVLAQVVDPQIGATLDVPSVGHWITVTNAKFIKELVKEIKPEIEYLKAELEIDPKLIVEGGDPFRNLGDPAEILQRIAVTVDNLSRVVTGARAFIKPGERPLLPVISREKLATVPIHPLDKDTLARQLKMEGMMDIASQGGHMETGDEGKGHGGMHPPAKPRKKK
ncbi:MAG TPA: galactose oxidase-like domain-containing protein [Candidatus Angelobacter sp.]|nr:galactose oxidase-like domain-containing protein [Candidatus Angelobacter sp.]